MDGREPAAGMPRRAMFYERRAPRVRTSLTAHSSRRTAKSCEGAGQA
jgi:hypothetical protein